MPGGFPRGCPASPVFRARCETGPVSSDPLPPPDLSPGDLPPRHASDGDMSDGDRAQRDEPAPECSAKGCRAAAVYVIAWNNPKIHTPERLKTWSACEEHRESLAGFLAARRFLREVVPIEEWKASRREA